MYALGRRLGQFAGLLLPVILVAGLMGCSIYKGEYDDYDAASGQRPSPKKLVFGRVSDSISLDPAIATENESFKVTVNIFDTLVKYEEEGSRLKPCLATSWEASEDGLTWLFNLRQGVRFHDGTVFDARAVEFNFQRWMNADSPYHTGKFNYWLYVFGGFPGFVKDITVLSDYRIKIVLSKPYAPFLNALSMPAFGIASPKAVEKYGNEFYRHPVGTGPFRFENWDKNRSIELAANMEYWNKAPSIDILEFRVIRTERDRLEQLKRGNVHIIDGLSTDAVASVKQDPRLNLYLSPTFNVGFLSMNMQKDPFNVREVRLAISHAIDKDRLVEEVFVDLAKTAKTLIPPFLWGYNDSIQPYGYDPGEAKRLLAAAGYPDGFETELWVMQQPRPYFTNPYKVAEYIKEDLEYVDIKVGIRVFEWEDYINKLKNGEHGMALIGWIGDNRDPDNFLYTLLGSDNAHPGMASNYSFYKDEKVDRLLVQARQTLDASFRSELYRTVQEKVHYDAPVIPLVHTMPALAADSSVKGFVPHIFGVASFEQVDIVNNY